MKKIKKVKYLLIVLVCVIAFKILWVFDPFLAFAYDLITFQSEVKEFNSSSFQWVKFSDLPEYEKKKFENKTCRQSNYEELSFIKVSWFDRYKNLIDDVKIYKFLTPDRLIRNRIKIPNLNKEQYLLIDKNVIEVFQKLRLELDKKGYNFEKLKITSAFRNPNYNKLIGGASCSQHQNGNAIDISVGDVNNDKKIDKMDVEIIYNLLNEKLIGNSGGLGQYENHPFLIHFDTRGHRARW